MTDNDLPPVIYSYAATHNTPCEAADNCNVQRGDVVYAHVNTGQITRHTYCKHHWEENLE